jgi:heme/copper-type cytochrome/quinol oxidase subunit 3
MQFESRQAQVTILGWFFLVVNILFFGVGFVAYLFLSELGTALGSTFLLQTLNAAGLATLFFFTLLALPGFLAGVALLQRQPWARSLALAVALLHLINFPLGTLLAIYAFRVLLPSEGSGEFRPLKTA